MGMRTKTEGQQPREWTSGMDRNTGVPYFIPEPMPILTLPKQCQLVLRVVGDESDSVGPPELRDARSRRQSGTSRTYYGKTLGVTASFAPVYSRQWHYSQAEKSLVSEWMWAVGGVAHAHMKTRRSRNVHIRVYTLQRT